MPRDRHERLRDDALGKPGAHAHGLKPEKEKEAEAIFRKWGLDFAVVGETTPTKRFIVRHGGAVMADLPIKELGDEAPVYDRPFAETEKRKIVAATDVSRRCRSPPRWKS